MGLSGWPTHVGFAHTTRQPCLKPTSTRWAEQSRLVFIARVFCVRGGLL